MGRLLLVATLAFAGTLALPAAASAWSIHNYRVRDAGPVINHRVTICTTARAGFTIRARVELRNGGDPHGTLGQGYVDEGCSRITLAQQDNLRYEGWYYGRLKVRHCGASGCGATRWTGWRAFWSE